MSLNRPDPGNPRKLRNFRQLRYWPTGTVYGTLLNFKDEVAALASQMTQPPYNAPPQAPVLYVKTANTWSFQSDSVPVPKQLAQVEVGATVAMVIGQTPQSIAGYVLLNDFSVPHASFFRPPVKFKCLDGFLGVGAALVLPEVAGNPAHFKLEVRINGQLKQVLDFSKLVRSAPTLLADVNDFMTLQPGDVLMLGCDCLPGGGRPLAQVGDRVEISSPDRPEMGVLSNTLVQEAL